MPGQTIFNSARGSVSSSTPVPGRVPGGRLTLTTGVPVTTADVTAVTNVFYTPYVHDSIELWTGSAWSPTIFTEVTQALGTLTNAIGYDVFGFLNAGALNTELLAWSSGTARATALTLTDGRYTKSGDKTRLYLGSFRTQSTTTTTDSAATRVLWNAYNRVQRALTSAQVTASHSYTTGSWREWNNGTSVVRLNLFAGLVVEPIGMGINAGQDGGYASWGFSTTVPQTAGAGQNVSGTPILQFYARAEPYPTLGYQQIIPLQFGEASVGSDFNNYQLNGACFA